MSETLLDVNGRRGWQGASPFAKEARGSLGWRILLLVYFAGFRLSPRDIIAQTDPKKQRGPEIALSLCGGGPKVVYQPHVLISRFPVCEELIGKPPSQETQNLRNVDS